MPACEDGGALMAQPLTAAAFAAFGTVIAVPAGCGHWINEGTAERFELLADLQLTQDGGRPVLSLSRASARTFPFTLREMERHALGSQSFVPLGVRRFVVVVAAAGAAPGAGDLRAFITDGQQGVCLAPGTWHHGLLAVDAGDYVVVERRSSVVDCDTCLLGEPVQLRLSPL
jgi:ureidoglycolate lyase